MLQLYNFYIVQAGTEKPELVENNNNENDDEWIEVDSLNNVCTSEKLQEHSKRSYRQLLIMVREFVGNLLYSGVSCCFPNICMFM